MDDRPQPRIDSVVSESLALIQGKWKVAILYTLAAKSELRFNELMKELEDISPKILAKQLQDMEAAGFIIRMIFPSNPPAVLYSLSYKGASLIPILQSLEDWGLKYLSPSYSDSRVRNN